MVAWILALLACGLPTPGDEPLAAHPPAPPAPPAEDALMAARARMVGEQLEARDIHDAAVLQAMRTVPRHRFVPEGQQAVAYYDGAVGIGWGQTISQPYVVAFMTQAMELRPGMRVLEVGTGSGYQAAVLSALGARVWSIEILPPLAAGARENLLAAGVPLAPGPEPGPEGAVHLRTGDGYRGWPAEEGGGAPYDRILVTASPDHVPEPLLAQLAEGGRMIVPVGDALGQHLVLLRRTPEGLVQERVLPVLFVPMTGEAQRP